MSFNSFSNLITLAGDDLDAYAMPAAAAIALNEQPRCSSRGSAGFSLTFSDQR